MTSPSQDAGARIEHKTDQILAALRDQNEVLRFLNARLDEFALLLAPRQADPGEPTLSDLIAHLIQQGREQLTLARRTVELLIAIQKTPPGETSAAHPHARPIG